jgi:hypothetical protein
VNQEGSKHICKTQWFYVGSIICILEFSLQVLCFILVFLVGHCSHLVQKHSLKVYARLWKQW